jgi:hypothetical protein
MTFTGTVHWPCNAGHTPLGCEGSGPELANGVLLCKEEALDPYILAVVGLTVKMTKKPSLWWSVSTAFLHNEYLQL